MAVNASNLINFGTSGLNVGDVTYSASALSAPSYLPLNNDTSSYLTSSYPALGAIYAPTTVAYSETTKTLPIVVGSSSSYSAFFGNKTFFLYNSLGSVLASADLTTWQPRSIPFKNQIGSGSVNGSGTTSSAYSTLFNSWKYMCYGNGRIVAVRNPVIFANYTTPVEATSASSIDGGLTWEFGGLPQYAGSTAAQVLFNWTNVAYGNGVFIATGTGYDANNYPYTFTAGSVDGLNWGDLSGIPAIGGGLGSQSTSVGATTYGNGYWVTIVIAWPTPNNTYTLAYSTNNGASWISTSTPSAFVPKACAYGNGVFVIVGTGTSNATTTTAYSSPTGQTWTARTLPVSTQWHSVTFANGYFVAIGTSGTIGVSTDGLTWSSQTITYSGNYIVAGGMGKFIYNYPNSSTLVQINLSASSTTFTLPTLSNPPFGLQPYIKAT